MHDEKVFKLVRASLLAALCFVLTKMVTIPAPTGYVNLGDCAVLLSVFLLGPVYGGFAAGIGTALADILSGFASYAPGTFVIKLAMASAAALIFQYMGKRNGFISRWVGAAVAESIMVVGYFAYESLILGVGLAAAASIPANVVQGVAGVISGVVLISAVEKSGTAFLRE